MDPWQLAPQEPIPVLLDVLEASGKTWRGWIVARDRGYATCWDLILGPEEEDLDPLCEIVQAWNPVRVSLPARMRILGQLSPYRLAALRTLAVDHENGFISGPPGEHRLGVALARELSDGTGVVTGTSIASDDDPRVEYQRIYREIAGKLPAPVQPAPNLKPQAARPSFLQRLLGLPAWQLGGAVATLLLAPLVVMMVIEDQPEQAQIAVAPPRPPPRQCTVTPARAKPSSFGLPIRRPRLRKSSKRCARSAPFPKPAVRGQTWSRSVPTCRRFLLQSRARRSPGSTWRFHRTES